MTNRRNLPEIHVAALNLPDKSDRPRWRIPQRRRPRAALRFIRRHGYDRVAVQEIADPLRRTLRRSRTHELREARPNNVLARGRRTLANGILARDVSPWRTVDRDQLHVPMPGRPRGLNMPVELLRHEGTGAYLVLVGIHFPAGDDAAATRRLALRMVIELHDRCRLAGLPFVVAGDTNSGISTARELYEAGLVVVVRERVDLIATSVDVDPVGRPEVHEQIRGRFTDHPAVACRLAIPLPAKRYASGRAQLPAVPTLRDVQ